MVPLVSFGNTDLRVSRVAFGAGPVSNLLTDSADQPTEMQVATIQRAIAQGINWFDTAATYAEGRSETILGKVLSQFKPTPLVHLATKARVGPEETVRIREAILRSIEGSLLRLQVSSVTLLQLHNSVTQARGTLPTSLKIEDVLGKRGVLETFLELKEQGVVGAIGITGIGDAALLKAILDSGEFASIQAPCHLLNPSGIRSVPEDLPDTDSGQTLAYAARRGLAAFAIRVLAGGALAGHDPSPHTLKTKFFPLDLYRRDRERATRLAAALQYDRPLRETALHYVLSLPCITSAIIGFATPEQVDEAVRIAQTPPLPPEAIAALEASVFGQIP